MNIFGKLFGSDTVIQKSVEGIYNGIDNAIYTQEERASRFERMLKLYEPFKIAQRFLALIFGIPYSIAWFFAFCASFIRDDINLQLEILNGTMGNIVLAIVAFYFLGGTASSITNKTKGN